MDWGVLAGVECGEAVEEAAHLREFSAVFDQDGEAHFTI